MKPILCLLAILVSVQAQAYPTGPYASVKYVRNAYGTTPVTTSAWVELVASMPLETNMMQIFDSSGQTMYFATGASGSEKIQFIIFPGGNGQLMYSVHQGDRVSVKAVATNATAGELDINFFQ